MTNATEWEWAVCRVEGLGDMLVECDGTGDALRVRRRLEVDIAQEQPGRFNLHVRRSPEHDLMTRVPRSAASSAARRL